MQHYFETDRPEPTAGSEFCKYDTIYYEAAILEFRDVDSPHVAYTS